jgi:hypothetical protein
MKWRHFNFSEMNETDVREELLSPLLDHLGYHAGAEGRVVRELPLRYQRLFLGRKNPKTDPLLKGRADYVLEVRDHARWVVEAKAPSASIDEDAIEQARSYAIHPEVNAVYFALSNGRRFCVYKTSAPPGSEPLLDFSYQEMSSNLARLEGLLSVEAIKRDYRDFFDAGEPLGNGLRSIAKIASGTIEYDNCSVPIPALQELSISIVDGVIERGVGGVLVASVITRGPVRSTQQVLSKMGLDKLEYISTDNQLSAEANKPTIFEYRGTAVFLAGEKMRNVADWTEVELPFDIRCEVTSVVKVTLSELAISGVIENRLNIVEFDQEVQFDGRVYVRLV